MSTIYVFPLNSFGEFGGYYAGDSDEKRITGLWCLVDMQQQGDIVVHCTSRDEARTKSQENSNNVGMPPLLKEYINNTNIEKSLLFNNNVKKDPQFNNNVSGYLKSLPRYPDGRRNYGTWAPAREAYQMKFKCFCALQMSEGIGQPPMDATFLALNAGCCYETVLSAVCRWIKSGHIRQFPFTPAPGMNKTYRLGKRGEHMLEKIKEKQPEWAEARRLELDAWLPTMNERLNELGVNTKSAHVILKENHLETTHKRTYRQRRAKVERKLCPKCGGTLQEYQGGFACFACKILLRDPVNGS